MKFSETAAVFVPGWLPGSGPCSAAPAVRRPLAKIGWPSPRETWPVGPRPAAPTNRPLTFDCRSPSVWSYCSGGAVGYVCPPP